MISLPTDDQLRAAGGWQAMQEARKIVQLGAVRSVDLAAAASGTLSGQILVGGADRRVILRWESVRDVKVSCSCPAARRGLVCAHGLALVLAARDPKPTSAPASGVKAGAETPGSRTASTPGERPPPPIRPVVATSGKQVQVKFPAGLRQSWLKNALPVIFVECPSGKDGPGIPLEDLLDWISGQVGPSPRLPPAIRLEGQMAGRFLDWLAGRQARVDSPEGVWEIATEPWRPSVRAERAPARPDTIRLTREENDGLVRTPGPGGWMMILGPESRGLVSAVFSTHLPVGIQPLFGSQSGRSVICELSVREFLTVAGELATACDFSAGEIGIEVRPHRPGIRMILDGTPGELLVRLEAGYPGGDAVALPASPEDANHFPRACPDQPDHFLSRDPETEAAALAKLVSWGFHPHAARPRTFGLKGEGVVLTFFAAMGRLVPADWEIDSTDRWRRATKDIETARFHFAGQASGAGWLEGEIACGTDSGHALSRADLHRLLRGRRGDFRAGNGKRIVVDLGLAAEIEEVWQDMDATQAGPGRFRFRADQENYLRAILGEKSESPQNQTQSQTPMLSEGEIGPVWEKLRPYQQAGVAWLAGQSAHGLGALLADDMGLGKTIQSLVFLEWQRRRGLDGPALVVCPTSLLGSWRDEAGRFLPGWKVMIQHGSGRNDQWAAMAAADLVITTYALLHRDLPRYRSQTFRAVVLDEASLIRNPDSQGAKAVHALEATTRLALTGTPVENSVRDLWSIMRFVQPGYLGRREDFKQRFEQALAGGDTAVANRLQKRLRPFILRRLKTEVAADLPARMEQIVWCEMEGPQAALYNAILRESRAKIEESIRKEGFPKARMGVLTALLRLRQVCCDPGLVDAGDDDSGGGAKRDLFRELLREAVDGGHRVLVFSQFVGMLERLREDVRALGLTCGWLTGASTDRAEQVRDFQSGSHPVFLLSLKAGGYGLTLTAADTVFLYDPWWNPAVEAQAIDRAHRIGQNKVVTAYRLVARGTVEEKILRLQDKKRDVAARTLGGTAEFDGLGEGDLRELLGV